MKILFKNIAVTNLGLFLIACGQAPTPPLLNLTPPAQNTAGTGGTYLNGIWRFTGSCNRSSPSALISGMSSIQFNGNSGTLTLSDPSNHKEIYPLTYTSQVVPYYGATAGYGTPGYGTPGYGFGNIGMGLPPETINVQLMPGTCSTNGAAAQCGITTVLANWLLNVTPSTGQIMIGSTVTATSQPDVFCSAMTQMPGVGSYSLQKLQ